jgi:hypothetical protein
MQETKEGRDAKNVGRNADRRLKTKENSADIYTVDSARRRYE